ANSLAAGLPAGGVNVVVLRDDDFDGVAANGRALNAVQSADLIAGRIDEEGPGFFVYFNTALDLNRLVYSTDLSSSAADLKIVARFLDQTGQGGVDALPQWSAANFVAVPEPATALLMLAGLAGLAVRRGRTPTAGP
ncbi:MAG: PEP-CTERM sorting domain-containing protein, partial [Gemmatimonadaceae bacterium]|nr:PEP-CTERM sorting domain-containing protein [Acetobacteraceae bacterium]